MLLHSLADGFRLMGSASLSVVKFVNYAKETNKNADRESEKDNRHTNSEHIEVSNTVEWTNEMKKKIFSEGLKNYTTKTMKVLTVETLKVKQ